MRIGNMDLLQNNLTQNQDVENLNKMSEKNSSKIEKGTKEAKYKEADKVAKEFETLFMEMMMKSMRETVKPEEETNAQNIYKSMLDSEYSKTMTDAQSFGIREMVRNWIVESSSSS